MNHFPTNKSLSRIQEDTSAKYKFTFCTHKTLYKADSNSNIEYSEFSQNLIDSRKRDTLPSLQIVKNTVKTDKISSNNKNLDLVDSHNISPTRKSIQDLDHLSITNNFSLTKNISHNFIPLKSDQNIYVSKFTKQMSNQSNENTQTKVNMLLDLTKKENLQLG